MSDELDIVWRETWPDGNEPGDFLASHRGLTIGRVFMPVSAVYYVGELLWASSAGGRGCGGTAVSRPEAMQAVERCYVEYLASGEKPWWGEWRR